jgi:hypothetical protein
LIIPKKGLPNPKDLLQILLSDPLPWLPCQNSFQTFVLGLDSCFGFGPSSVVPEDDPEAATCQKTLNHVTVDITLLQRALSVSFPPTSFEVANAT